MDQKKTKVCKYCKTEIPADAKVCPQCRKKQGGKGKWIVLAVVVIVVLLAAIGSSGDDAPSASESAPVVTDAPTPETEQTADTAVPTGTPVPTATPEPETTSYESGMYLVGQDMPAGEYRVALDDNNSVGMGYIEVSTDSSHLFDSIRTNDNIEGASYITVNEGEYLTLNGCHIEQ